MLSVVFYSVKNDAFKSSLDVSSQPLTRMVIKLSKRYWDGVPSNKKQDARALGQHPFSRNSLQGVANSNLGSIRM